MYITFDINPPNQYSLDQLKQEIEDWAKKYSVTYTTKVHKLKLRLGLNKDRDFTTFTMTWSGSPYELVNVANERY